MNPAWALLRLASPQLPIGGYSYSQGLEMAVEQGLVKDPDSARRWIGDQLLLNLARFEAPLLLAHCEAAAAGDWPGLAHLAGLHRASRETRELRLESRQMGYSLKQLLDDLPELDAPSRHLFEQIEEPGLALGWALAARAWRIRQPMGERSISRLAARRVSGSPWPKVGTSDPADVRARCQVAGRGPRRFPWSFVESNMEFWREQ